MAHSAASFLERYHAGASPVHRLDARVKLVATLGFIAAVTATPPGAWPVFAALAVLAWAVAFAAQLPWTTVLRRSMIAIPFMLIAAPSVFARPGEPLGQFHVFAWTLTASREGLEFFLGVLVKSWVAVIAAGVLIATTRFEDLTQALQSLRVPRLLVAVIASMYRYSFVLVDEAMRLNRARVCRSGEGGGRRSGGPVPWRARVLGNMVGSLFIRTYERSERVHMAMLARGYDGEMRMAAPRPLSRPTLAALAAVLALLAGMEALAALRW